MLIGLKVFVRYVLVLVLALLFTFLNFDLSSNANQISYIVTLIDCYQSTAFFVGLVIIKRAVDIYICESIKRNIFRREGDRSLMNVVC